jgi:hypothetical protein
MPEETPINSADCPIGYCRLDDPKNWPNDDKWMDQYRSLADLAAHPPEWLIPCERCPHRFRRSADVQATPEVN